MKEPVAHRCGRCGEWAAFHYAPPHDAPDRGTLHACAAHAPAAEARWRQIYPEAAE